MQERSADAYITAQQAVDAVKIKIDDRRLEPSADLRDDGMLAPRPRAVVTE